MPEIHVPRTESIDRIRSEVAQKPLFAVQLAHANKNGSLEGAYLGIGLEKVVVPLNEGKVIAFHYAGQLATEAKYAFFTQKIFSTLFPFNFPNMYASFGNKSYSPTHVTGSIQQRIYGEEIEGSVTITHPFSHVIKTLDRYGVDFSFDRNPRNFLVGKNGGEYYVDTIHLPNAIHNLLHLTRRQYGPELEKKFVQYIERIQNSKNILAA